MGRGSVRRFLLFGGLLVAAVLPSPLSAEIYEVKSGDSLSSIAADFGISQTLIESLNPELDSPDLLFVGQQLTLPDGVIPVSSSVILTHTVQPGDTLNAIAAFYGVDAAIIQSLNPGLNADLLFVGTELTVRDDLSSPASAPTTQAPDPTPDPTVGADSPPPVTTTPSGVTTVAPYLVLPGDTYSGLAERFNTTIAKLFALNPRVPPNALQAGSLIFVPHAGGVVLAPSDPATAGFDGTEPYLVVPGDSASLIAQNHGVTLAQLAAANPDVDLATVFVGQTLNIPLPDGSATTTTVTDPTTPLDLTVYLVRPGDNATLIAEIHKLSLLQLRALNPSQNLDLLQAGQQLVVPLVDLPPPPPGTVPAGAPPPRHYTIVAGDTLTAVAAGFGLSADVIIGLNPRLDPNLLVIGQDLRIPGTTPIPTASRIVTTDFGDSLEYVAARLGVLPHTLIANNPFIGDVGFIAAGATFVVPDREGILVYVQQGDTLAAIAAIHGTTIDAIVSDPRSGVTDSNGLIIGQELIVPIFVPDFIWPATGQITDGYGVCRTLDCSVRHGGVDIAQFATAGGPILAAAPGVVTFAGGSYCCGLGFNVEIDHGNGWFTRYAHLNGPPPVVLGQQVAQGDTVGFSGTTGFSTGVHLHLEMEHNGWGLDALNYLP